jgi:hypothetical protein
LLGRQGERRNQFHQYLHDHFRHCCCGRDPGVNIKPVEEIPDAFEQVDESIQARVNVLDRLIRLDVTRVQNVRTEKGTDCE